MLDSGEKMVGVSTMAHRLSAAGERPHLGRILVLVWLMKFSLVSFD